MYHNFFVKDKLTLKPQFIMNINKSWHYSLNICFGQLFKSKNDMRYNVETLRSKVSL